MEKPATFDALHRLLEAQHYRLAYWRTSAHEINYRRFFDVDELVGVRMEDRQVFDAAHRLVSTLIAEGRVTGFESITLDGLAAPGEHCERLQQLAGAAVRRGRKILAPDQTVPDQWAVDGTTATSF